MQSFGHRGGHFPSLSHRRLAVDHQGKWGHSACIHVPISEMQVRANTPHISLRQVLQKGEVLTPSPMSFTLFLYFSSFFLNLISDAVWILAQGERYCIFTCRAHIYNNV